jgi:diguanylate cyclase
VDKRSDIAAGALRRLAALGIPPTPPHFAVWYSYIAGDNAELKRAVDALLASPERITEDMSRALYDRFFRPRDPFEDSIDFSQRIQTSAGHVLEALEAAGSGAKRYGQALQNFSGGIAKAEDEDDIARMIKGILSETKAMEAHNQALRAQVEASTSEITQLKNTLADARRDAITDPLTGLNNRKAFDRAVRDEASHARATGESISLVMCDIDHFKRVNDTHGHQVGDQVLKLVAQTIRQCVKGQDIAARYGGEEFAVILPQTNVMGAAAVAEFIRRTVESKKIVRKGTGDNLGSVTMSFGVATLTPGEEHEGLIGRADRALYISKQNGRNRVTTDKGLHLKDAVNL